MYDQVRRIYTRNSPKVKVIKNHIKGFSSMSKNLDFLGYLYGIHGTISLP